MASTYERAVRILTGRDHGSAELTRKLKRKGCPADEVDDAVARLRKLGYLNDDALLVREVERLVAGGFGPRAIRHKLRGRGFEGEPLEAALGQVEERDGFREACAVALRRKCRPFEGRWERPAWLKAARFLAGRGFPEHLVRATLRAYEAEGDE